MKAFRIYGTARVSVLLNSNGRMYGPYVCKDIGQKCWEYERPILPRVSDFNMAFHWDRDHSKLTYVSNGYSGTIASAIFEKHILKHLTKPKIKMPRRKN